MTIPYAQNAPAAGVVIPVFGESEAICRILEAFPKNIVDTICLVVDAPSRHAMNRIREIAGGTGMTVRIIKNAHRTGVGSSIRQGLSYLRQSGHEIAVIMAGNGKDDPLDIVKIVGPVMSGFDYVQGSRYLSGGRKARMPLVRRVFNRIYPILWWVLTGRRCTDVTNGFRCYRLDVLDDEHINLNQEWLDGYALEYYLHYKMLTLGYKMKEVPVSKTYPFGHRGGYSKIQPLRDWWSIVSPPLLLFLGVRN